MTAITLEQDQTAKPSRLKGLLKRAFTKAADIGARGAVTTGLKVFATTTVLGAGASGMMAVSAAALAAGTGAFAYTYAKESFKDWQQAKKEQKQFSWFQKNRLKQSGLSFAFGLAGGAFGGWLADNDTFKEGMQRTASWLGEFFIPATEAAPMKPAVIPFQFDTSVDSVLRDLSATSSAEALMSEPQTEPVVISMPEPQPEPEAIVEHTTEQAAPEPQHNTLQRLETALSGASAVPERLQDLVDQVGTLDKAAGWQLKDMAHFVLRTEGLPMEDRLELARDLALAAQERGSKQATDFLNDLALLGMDIDPKPAVPEQVATPEPVTSAPVTPESAPQELAPQEPALVTKQYNAAATCTVTGDNPAQPRGVSCVSHTETMAAGDYVDFVSASNENISTRTYLADGSVAVKTDIFLHPTIIAEGLQKLDQTQQLAMARRGLNPVL